MLNFEAFVNACKTFSGSKHPTFKVYFGTDGDYVGAAFDAETLFQQCDGIDDTLCVDVITETGRIGWFALDYDLEICDHRDCEFCNSVVAEVIK